MTLNLNVLGAVEASQEKYYIQPVKDRDLFMGRCSARASVGDPYTTYFELSRARISKRPQGKLEGIGAEIGSKMISYK